MECSNRLELIGFCLLTAVVMPAESFQPTASSGIAREQKFFQTECVELFARLAHMIGLPRSIGQIYGLIYGSARPLSFTDIVAQLDISKGSASQGLRALREVGGILPAPVVPGRREHFVPETELRKLIAGFLDGSFQPHLRRGAKRLDGFKGHHAVALAAQGGNGRLLLGRLGKLQNWHRKGAVVLPLIAKYIG